MGFDAATVITYGTFALIVLNFILVICMMGAPWISLGHASSTIWQLPSSGRGYIKGTRCFIIFTFLFSTAAVCTSVLRLWKDTAGEMKTWMITSILNGLMAFCAMIAFSIFANNSSSTFRGGGFGSTVTVFVFGLIAAGLSFYLAAEDAKRVGGAPPPPAKNDDAYGAGIPAEQAPAGGKDIV